MCQKNCAEPASERLISIFSSADCCSQVTTAATTAAIDMAISSGFSQACMPPTRMRSTKIRAKTGTAIAIR